MLSSAVGVYGIRGKRPPARWVRLPVAALTVLFAVAVLPVAASADHHGGYKQPAPTSYPASCLTTVTLISENTVPDKHNAAAANTCLTDHAPGVILYQRSANGALLNQCQNTALQPNYTICQLQVGTGSGEYWGWEAYFPTVIGADYSCQGFAAQYQACFESID